MKPDRPLLSLVIPTYNRAQLLDRLLDLLQREIGSDDRLELLISDNASTDSTGEVVKAYQQKGLEVGYWRNDENRGADFNILRSYQLASGRYVWIFSDDDLIAPGTLNRVLETIGAKQYDLVCVRPYFFVGEYKGHRAFTHRQDWETTNAVDFARQVHVMFTFISGIIVNKERVSAVPHPDFELLLNTNLVQLGLYFTALSNQRRCLLIRDPLIAATANTDVNYEMYRVFGVNFSKITREWIADQAVQKAILSGVVRVFFPSWILQTRKNLARNIKPLEDPHRVLSGCFGNDFRYWLFSYPVWVLPLPIAKIWVLGVRAVNRGFATITRSFARRAAEI